MNYFLDYYKESVPEKYERIIISDSFLKSCVPERKTTVLSPINYRDEEYVNEYNKIRELSDRFCIAISKWLIKKYGIEFNKEQVRYIWGSFFIQHIYMTCEKYNKVKTLNVGDVYFEIPKCDVVGIRECAIEDEKYNAFIYGQILKRLGAHEISDSQPVEVDRSNEKMETMGGRLITLLEDLIRNPKKFNYNIRRLNGYRHMFARVPKKHANYNSILIRTFLDEEIEKEIINESEEKIYSIDPNIFYKSELENYKIRTIDRELREEALKDFQPDDELEEMVKVVVMALMPLSLCENFYSIYKAILPIANLFSVNKVYSAARYDVPIAIFAAIKKSEGAKIIDIQHSGMYIFNQAIAYPEIHCYDEFITWSDYGSYPFGKVRTVAPVRFSNKRNTKPSTVDEKIDRILFISNDIFKYDIGYGLCDPSFFDRHFSFVEALPKEYREKLTVRLRNDTYGFAKTYAEKYPEVTVEYAMDCPIIDSINKSSIVVLDINSSAYYESLTVGKPTLLFDGINLPVYHDRMKEWFLMLGAKKLYAHEGSELARIVIKNGDELIKKWNGQEIQSLIDGYLRYAMNYGCDIKEAWKKEWNAL